MNWNLVKIFTDPGYSGANMERPALQSMINDIKAGKTDIVLVDKLDRLSRSQFDTLYMIQKIFMVNDIAFVSRAEAFDTSTAFGRAMVGILAVFAELERERIKERMKDGKTGRAKEGKYKGGGYVPTGYVYNSKTGYLEINDYDAFQVKEVFELFNKRTPIYTIMNILNNKGYKTSNSNKKWNETRIRNILENQTYIGKLKHLNTWVDGGHTPIIDMETWNKTQEILKERKSEYKKQGRKYKSSLGGLLWCNNCGARYHYRQAGKNKDGSVRGYYICYSREHSNKEMIKDPNCKNKTYRDYILEDIIFKEVLKLKTDPEYLQTINNSNDNSRDIKILESKIIDIKKQIDKLIDLYAIGTIDINNIKIKTDTLNNELNKLNNTLNTLKNEVHNNKDAKDILNITSIFTDAINKKDTYIINALLNELIEKIIIDNEDIIIHWNF